jgi:hypothetical protein
MNTIEADSINLTEGNRALQLFTDRNEFTKRFAEYLNDDPPPEKILFFHGEGGNGKTLLLKFLREKCCKRFSRETWSRLKAMPDKELAKAVSSYKDSSLGDVQPVPACLLDFRYQRRGNDQDCLFYALMSLRRNLADAASASKYRLKFPRYDFACVWYLYRQGKSSAEIRKLFPPEEMELIGVIVDALVGGFWGNLIRSVINTVAKYMGVKAGLFWWKRGLDEKWIARIKAMDPEAEVIPKLPEWFARDLSAAMKEENSPHRLALFFDSHEALWGHRSYDGSSYSYFYQDEWLRRLLKHLDLSAGIVVAFAGREKPRWDEAAKFSIRMSLLDTRLVWHLSDSDAALYLKNAGISDPELQKALIRYASVSPDQVHPFYLGLCADLVLTAGNKGAMLRPDDFETIPELANRTRELIQRLLQYVREDLEFVIEAVSACRGFDFDLYHRLGQELHFRNMVTDFRILTRFSFVWPDKQGREDRYRIHDLLRRLYHEARHPVTRKAHGILERYHREQGDLPEAVYHAICQDRNRGEAELKDAHQRAFGAGDLELCRKLQEIRNETFLSLDRSPNQ